MRAQGFALRPPALGKLAATGAMLGPACDAIHNQLLLTYDRFPVAIGDAKTSLLIPPLLALTYALLGGVFPLVAQRVVGAGGAGGDAPTPLVELKLLSRSEERRARAVLAVLATCAVIKLSAVAIALDAPNSLALLAVAALLEWRALDASWTSLAVGCVVAVLGPIAEVPFMELGCWHYFDAARDYFPLHSFLVDSQATGISSLTGPCYFAVTTDAIALGRWYSGEDEVG